MSTWISTFSAPIEPVAFDARGMRTNVRADAVDARDEFSSCLKAVSDDFDLNLDDAFAEPADEPVAEVAAAAVQPTAPAAPVMAEPVPAPVANERASKTS